MMIEKTVSLTPLSDHDNEKEESNQTASLSNKCSKKQRLEYVSKKVRTLEKIPKYKSWV